MKVAEYLSVNSECDQVGALYLTGENSENEEQIIDTLKISADKIFRGPDIIKDINHMEWFKGQEFDFLISVYWPWLFDKEVFDTVGKTINFHPALLPINRGWFPHVHSIIDGTKTGVTIHEISSGADTGKIWAQKEVPILEIDTAKEIYDRLQIEIVELFKENWNDIQLGKISPEEQNEDHAVYHSKFEIEKFDYIDINKKYFAKDILNILRARTFGDRGFAYYESNGEKIYIKINLAKNSKFID